MRKKSFIRLAVFIFLTVCGFNNARAQVQPITFVTANGGSDTNLCTRSAPCRQIQRGVQMTMSGGTVVILDSGDYEVFTITRSVNVIAEKGISAIVGNAHDDAGVTIEEDGAAEQIIELRGLTLTGSSQGIRVNASITSLSVEDCSIKAVSYGIYVGSAGRYFFKNIQVAHTDTGLRISSTSGQRIVAVIDDSRFEQLDTTGVVVRGTDTSVTIRNSISTYSPTGFLAAGSGKMSIENSIVNNNTWGISVESSGAANVSNSTITFNGTGIRSSSGGAVRIFGNNRFSNNSVANLSGTIISVSQQ